MVKVGGYNLFAMDIIFAYMDNNTIIRLIPKTVALMAVFVAVLQRWRTHDFLKQARKIQRVVKAQGKADFLYAHGGKAKVLAGFLDFEVVEIMYRRIPRALLEQRKKMRRRVTKMRRHIVNLQGGIEVLFHILNSGLNGIIL